MVEPYAVRWAEANDLARRGDGPLWVALGDSATQGVGATSPERGYVGQVLDALSDRDGVGWRVLNLSVSGARARDVLAGQLPRLEALDVRPELVSCLVGGNDLVRTPVPRLVAEMREIARRRRPEP